MARELIHEEAAELLGVYALDAVDDDERRLVDAHLAGCQECWAELRGLLEAAAALSSGYHQAPPGVWERIAGSLDEATMTAGPPPMIPEAVAPVVAIDDLARRRQGRGRTLVAAAITAAVAASVIGVLGMKVVDDGHRLGQLEAGAHGEELVRVVNAARADDRARQVVLRSADGLVFAETVMMPDGTGYLVKNNLPALGSGRTYQLWALAGTGRVSIGVLGPAPGQTPFRASGPMWGIAITEEPATGVATTDHDPLVSGKLSEA